MTAEINTLCDVAQVRKGAQKGVNTTVGREDLPVFKAWGQWCFRRTNLDVCRDANTRRAAREEMAE